MIFKSVLITSLFTIWWTLSDASLRSRSIFAAFAFFAIESVYLQLQGKRKLSTFAQFWNNVWSHWFISDLYFVHTMSGTSAIFRILLYPLVIWVLEIVQSQVIIFVYGRNVAWDYSGHKLARLNGSIHLGMWPEWMLLACAMEFIYYPRVVGIF